MLPPLWQICYLADMLQAELEALDSGIPKTTKTAKAEPTSDPPKGRETEISQSANIGSRPGVAIMAELAPLLTRHLERETNAVSIVRPLSITRNLAHVLKRLQNLVMLVTSCEYGNVCPQSSFPCRP